MPGLPPPLRYVEAAEIRSQGQAVPDQTHIPWGTNGYPKEFHNYNNKLPLTHPPLQQHHMRLEHPALAKGNYQTGPPGPARHVVNDGDRATTNLIYHDPNKPIIKCKQRGGCGSSGFCMGTGKCKGPISYDFSMANYHPNPSPCAGPFGCGSPGNCLMWYGRPC
jgi:hypothetical protein